MLFEVLKYQLSNPFCLRHVSFFSATIIEAFFYIKVLYTIIWNPIHIRRERDQIIVINFCIRESNQMFMTAAVMPQKCTFRQ